MERLEAKKVNGKTYYYYTKWGWRDGKCRRLWQKYLGKLEDIAQAIDGGPAPACAEVFELGLPIALWAEAVRQGVARAVDTVCPKRNQGLSIGEYVLLAAVNRAADPVSKNGMWGWFAETALRRLLPGADEAALASQRFWDHMDAIGEADVARIWQGIIGEVMVKEQVDLSQVCYDGTNFYSFISTFNSRSGLAKRGKNKQGRGNLRQVSYALFCTRDGHLPIFHDVYEGNTADATQFPAMVGKFEAFVKALPGGEKLSPNVTIVFDKGNNSAANIALLDRENRQFVGSVKLGEHPDLAGIPSRDPRLAACARPGMERFHAYRTEKTIYGKKRAVVLMFNQELFDTQWQTLQADIAKATGELAEIAQRLADRASGRVRHGRAPTVKSLRQHCEQACKRPFLNDVIKTEVAADGNTLQYSVDDAKLAQVANTLLGKKIIITSQLKWDTETIIETYHGQFVIEHVFREMKDRDIGTWWPLHHWTDQKIRVHGLYCTIALLLRALIQRRAAQNGLALPMARLLRELGGIREVINIYESKKRGQPPRSQAVMTKLNPTQEKLVDLLGVKRLMGNLG